MNAKQYVGKRVSSFEEYDSVGPITGIALVIDENNEYLAGDQNGYVLEVECPYGTQAMANNMLASVKGQIYKGYRAENAIMAPQAELGDGVTIAGNYSMLAYRSVEFGPGHMSEIAAPGENELNHEYQYISPTQRKIDRKISEARSSITKTAEEIRLEVAGVDGRVSSVKQYVDSITLSVSNGSTSSTIALKAGDTTISSKNITFSGFVTFNGLSGGTTTIDGACIKTGTIDADRLNLTGAITFSDLSSSLYNQVNNSITSSEARTLINSTLISSPTIAGGTFSNLGQDVHMRMQYSVGNMGYLALYSDSYSIQNEFLAIGLYSVGLGTAVLINPFTWESGSGKPSIEFHGDDYFGSTRNTGLLVGNWNFGSATITGLKTASLSLGAAESEPVAAIFAAGEDAAPRKVTLSDNDGILKVETDGVTWYLDAAGWHK